MVAEHGVIRSVEVQRANLPTRYLTRMVASGELARLSRGLYGLATAEWSLQHSLAEVAKRNPRAVICLISALNYHEIGTQLPHEVWIAIPAGTRANRLDSVTLRTFKFSGKSYAEGIETHDVEGVPVKIYSPAKTVADIFKMRNKVGFDVAIEALREAWRDRKITMDDLWRFAKINRVDKVMTPYIVTVVAS